MSVYHAVHVEPNGPHSFEARYWREDEGRYFYRVADTANGAAARLITEHGIRNARIFINGKEV